VGCGSDTKRQEATCWMREMYILTLVVAIMHNFFITHSNYILLKGYILYELYANRNAILGRKQSNKKELSRFFNKESIQVANSTQYH
jgi:hypothetical protein